MQQRGLEGGKGTAYGDNKNANLRKASIMAVEGGKDLKSLDGKLTIRRWCKSKKTSSSTPSKYLFLKKSYQKGKNPQKWRIQRRRNDIEDRQKNNKGSFQEKLKKKKWKRRIFIYQKTCSTNTEVTIRGRAQATMDKGGGGGVGNVHEHVCDK